MPKLFIFFLFLAGTLAAATNNPAVKWYGFNEGRDAAVKAGKPFFVDIYTDWCHWCKVMDEKTFNDSSVSVRFGKDIYPVKINAEGKESVKFDGRTFTAAEFTKALGVTGFPSIAFFDKSGNIIGVLPGYQEAAGFNNLIDFVTDEGYKNFKTVEDYLAAKKAASK